MGNLITDFLGGGEQVTENNADFNDTIKPLAEKAVTGLQGTDVPTFFPEATVAPQSNNTLAGIKSLGGTAGVQNDIGATALNGFNFTLNDMLNPETNKALQAYMTGAINPIFDRLENQTLPGIGGNAVSAGQFGGTAQGNLQRDAIDSTTRNAFDTTAAIASNAYQGSLDNYTQTLLNAGNVQRNQTAGANTLLGAGGIEDQFSQNLVNADVNRHNFNETAEEDYYSRLLSLANQGPVSTTQTTTGGGTSPINAALSAYLAYQTFGGGGAPGGTSAPGFGNNILGAN